MQILHCAQYVDCFDHLIDCEHGPSCIQRLCYIIYNALLEDKLDVQREQRMPGESTTHHAC